MKNSFLLTLTAMIFILLAISPVIAQPELSDDKVFVGCVGKTGYGLSSTEIPIAIDTCATPILQKLNGYPEASAKFKELVEAKKTWDVYGEFSSEQVKDCKDVCDTTYENCKSVANANDVPIGSCTKENFDICFPECTQKFSANKFNDPHNLANVQEDARLKDVFWGLRDEYLVLISGDKNTKLVPKEIKELEEIGPEGKKSKC